MPTKEGVKIYLFFSELVGIKKVKKVSTCCKKPGFHFLISTVQKLKYFSYTI